MRSTNKIVTASEVYLSQEKPKMKGILPFQLQAQQVAHIKKPVKTFIILASQTDICEWLESYVKNQLEAKMEGSFLFLVLLVRNILQSLSQNFCHDTYKISIDTLPLTFQIKLKPIEALSLIFHSCQNSMLNTKKCQTISDPIGCFCIIYRHCRCQEKSILAREFRETIKS